MVEKQKHIFSRRLREYAIARDNILAAIERTEGYEDENFRPSRYTPSLAESRRNHSKLLEHISGYCRAVDDALGYEYGTTERQFYDITDKRLHVVPPYEDVDNDSGHQSAIYLDKEIEANTKFTAALFPKSSN